MFKPHPRLAALTLCALFVLSGSAQAQEKNWAEKMFSSLNLDFGVVARGADVKKLIKVTNIYEETVYISNVRTSCGCASAKANTQKLETYESAFIEVSMNTTRFKHDKNSNVIVTFSQPLPIEVTVPVHCYIRTDVVLTPGSANFGTTDKGAGAQRKLTIEGRDNWSVTDVQVKNEHLSAEVKEVRRGGGQVAYDLLIDLKPSAPVGVLRDTINLVTDDANSPYVPVLVEANVESDITVTPSFVSFGNLSPGATETVNVVVRGKKEFEIERIECESEMEAFRVKLPEASKRVHVLPLTVTAPDKAGKFTELFTLTVPGRDEPVTFKAYGRVVNIATP